MRKTFILDSYVAEKFTKQKFSEVFFLFTLYDKKKTSPKVKRNDLFCVDKSTVQTASKLIYFISSFLLSA